MSENCNHESFECNVNVNRIDDIGRFVADITIFCSQCKTKFRFIGLRHGMQYDSPMVSVDATEARMPIAPKDEVVSELEGTPKGYSIRKKPTISELEAILKEGTRKVWILPDGTVTDQEPSGQSPPDDGSPRTDPQS
jgi:hypothetical protein